MKDFMCSRGKHEWINDYKSNIYRSGYEVHWKCKYCVEKRVTKFVKFKKEVER